VLPHLGGVHGLDVPADVPKTYQDPDGFCFLLQHVWPAVRLETLRMPCMAVPALLCLCSLVLRCSSPPAHYSLGAGVLCTVLAHTNFCS
jgi:hypothetical protein